MTYTTNTTIMGPSQGSVGIFYTLAKGYASDRLADVKLYLETVYRIAPQIGMRAEVVVMQSWHETADAETGAPWTSYWWRERCNPAGIGITGDEGENNASRDFGNGESAALAQMTHLYLYAVGTKLPTGLSRTDDPRWQDAIDAGYAGIAPTLAGLTGRWGVDKRYADKIVAHLNTVAQNFVDVTIPEKENPPVSTAFKRYTLPGLPNPVYFPDWLAVEVKLIPNGTPGWTSGQKVPASQFTSTTYHDTDNTSSSARSEYDWAAKGGRAEINSPGSYNGIFDANVLVITQRFDELVGHAANHTGNVTSYAFEEAFGATGHAASLRVGEWVHAGILQSMGKSGGTEAMYQHNFWNGKDCPRQIRNRGEWSKVEKAVDAHVAEINAWVRAQEGGAPPKPEPETPVETPKLAYPEGMTKTLAASLFGKAVGSDKRTYAFDENGPVSRFWVEEGKRTGQFPALVSVTVIGTAKYFTFSNGLVYWTPEDGRAPLRIMKAA